MVRSDPVNALRHVINAIDASDLLTPLGHISQSSRPADASDFLHMLLSSYSEFHATAKAFSNAEKRVCEIMRLEGLFDGLMWRKLIRTKVLDSFQLVQLHDLHTRVHFATNYLPDLIALTESRDQPLMRVDEDKTVLALGVRQLDAQQGVDTSQLAHALHGIEMVYVACCIMNKIGPGHLTVQSWRGHPVPMFSILVEQLVRGSVDKVLVGLQDVVLNYQGHRSRTSLTDTLIGSKVFDQLEAIAESKVIDRESYDSAADMLLEGCLELLSASVVPPGLPPSVHGKLDTISVVADHELRAHLDDVDLMDAPESDDASETGEDLDGDDEALEAPSNVVMLKGPEFKHDVQDGADEQGALNDDGYDEYDDDYDDRQDDGYDESEEDEESPGDFPAVAYATPEDSRYDDEYDDDALQIDVEMDGQPIEVEDDAAIPELPYVEPELVTNKAFKRALKDLRKRRR